MCRKAFGRGACSVFFLRAGRSLNYCNQGDSNTVMGMSRKGSGKRLDGRRGDCDPMSCGEKCWPDTGGGWGSDRSNLPGKEKTELRFQ